MNIYIYRYTHHNYNNIYIYTSLWYVITLFIIIFCMHEPHIQNQLGSWMQLAPSENSPPRFNLICSDPMRLGRNQRLGRREAAEPPNGHFHRGAKMASSSTMDLGVPMGYPIFGEAHFLLHFEQMCVASIKCMQLQEQTTPYSILSIYQSKLL